MSIALQYLQMLDNPGQDWAAGEVERRVAERDGAVGRRRCEARRM